MTQPCRVCVFFYNHYNIGCDIYIYSDNMSIVLIDLIRLSKEWKDRLRCG